jgi:tryptophanase
MRTVIPRTFRIQVVEPFISDKRVQNAKNAIAARPVHSFSLKAHDVLFDLLTDSVPGR